MRMWDDKDGGWYGVAVLRPDLCMRIRPAPWQERLRCWFWRRVEDLGQIVLLAILFLALSVVFR